MRAVRRGSRCPVPPRFALRPWASNSRSQPRPGHTARVGEPCRRHLRHGSARSRWFCTPPAARRLVDHSGVRQTHCAGCGDCQPCGPHGRLRRMRVNGREKLRDHAPYLAELKEDGVENRLMIWSCWGRPPTDASNAVRSMAQAAARRHGAVRARDLERRACRALGVQFWKRAAQMVDACRPALAAEDVDLVLPASVACARARLGRTKGPGNSSSCCSSRGSSNSGDRSRSSSPRGPSSSVHPPSRPSGLLVAGGAQFEGGRGAGVGHVAACDSAAGTCIGERALAEEAAASGAEAAAGGLAGGALQGGASAALLGGEGSPGGLGTGAAAESRAPCGQEAG